MKLLGKLSIICVVICLIFSICSVQTSAASNATLYFSNNPVKVGDKVTVSVAINPNEAMYGVEFYLQYNDSVLKYDSGNGNENSAGVLKIVESPSGDKSVKYSFTFKAEKNGSSTISVTDCVFVTTGDSGSQKKSFGGASATLTVKDATLSKDATLKSLKVSGYSLSPSFSSSKTSYSLSVSNDTKKINVTANPTDSKAKVVSVEGNKDLEVGKNTVTVTVEAENGTQKKYKITVTREKEETSSVESSQEEETNSETEQEESLDEELSDAPLKTTISGKDYVILSKIPEKYLIKGFSIENKIVNGFDVETAVDANSNYRLFYLKSENSDKPIPYIYDEVLDQFEKLQYLEIDNRYYIFSDIPSDITVPNNLYSSTLDILDYSVDCLTFTTPELSDLSVVYCYSNNVYNYYRYDTKEGTLQRYPEFNMSIIEAQPKDTVLTRFSRLSLNGKVIVISMVVLILGIFTLLILLIIYLIRKSGNRYEYVSDDYDDFDVIDVETERNVLK